MGLREGFQKFGIEVVTAWPHPTGQFYESIVENFCPDAVLEINRSKDQIPNRKHDVCHVTILHESQVDQFLFHETNGSSELYYSIMQPSLFGYPKELDKRAKPFIAGADLHIAERVQRRKKKFDLGLIEEVPHPKIISKQFLLSSLVPKQPRYGTFKDLILFLKIDEYSILRSSDIKKSVRKYFKQKGNISVGSTFLNKIVSFCTMFAHSLHRMRMASLMIKTRRNTAFWGASLWKTWKQFAPYYQGEISSAQSLYDAILSTHINVHRTGINLHSRITDAMTVGVSNAIMHNDSDSGPFGIEQFFEPDVDFIRFDFDNFSDKIREYLKYPKRIDEISQHASQKIRTQYTWKNICHRMLNDIKKML